MNLTLVEATRHAGDRSCCRETVRHLGVQFLSSNYTTLGLTAREDTVIIAEALSKVNLALLLGHG